MARVRITSRFGRRGHRWGKVMGTVGAAEGALTGGLSGLLSGNPIGVGIGAIAGGVAGAASGYIAGRIHGSAYERMKFRAEKKGKRETMLRKTGRFLATGLWPGAGYAFMKTRKEGVKWITLKGGKRVPIPEKYYKPEKLKMRSGGAGRGLGVGRGRGPISVPIGAK